MLHCAAQTAQLEVVQLCLAGGADPNQGNTRQETPLHLVSAFFSRGEHIHLHLILTTATGHSRKVAEELLQGGANLNARTSYGDTAAHYAARHGTVCTLKYLLYCVVRITILFIADSWLRKAYV